MRRELLQPLRAGARGQLTSAWVVREWLVVRAECSAGPCSLCSDSELVFLPKPLPRNIDAALRDVRDTKLSVRRSALNDLARFAEGQSRSSALEAIQEALLSDVDADVRADAAVALADVDGREALPALLEAASDAHERVREMALLAIGELSPPEHREVVPLLERNLQAGSSAVRFQALVAAQRVGLPQWEQKLVAASRDADPKIRYLAFRLMEEHFDGERPPDFVLSRIVSALTDPEPEVAAAAAMLGAPSGLSAARKRLVDAINQGLRLPAPEDEQTLIELCGELSLDKAIPGLRRVAWGRFGLVPGRFAWHAKVALARLGDAAARRQLQRGLHSRNRDARTLAVAAVGRARWVELRPELERMQRAGLAEPEALTEALELLAQD